MIKYCELEKSKVHPMYELKVEFEEPGKQRFAFEIDFLIYSNPNEVAVLLRRTADFIMHQISKKERP